MVEKNMKMTEKQLLEAVCACVVLHRACQFCPLNIARPDCKRVFAQRSGRQAGHLPRDDGHSAQTASAHGRGRSDLSRHGYRGKTRGPFEFGQRDQLHRHRRRLFDLRNVRPREMGGAQARGRQSARKIRHEHSYGKKGKTGDRFDRRELRVRRERSDRRVR